MAVRFGRERVDSGGRCTPNRRNHSFFLQLCLGCGFSGEHLLSCAGPWAHNRAGKRGPLGEDLAVGIFGTLGAHPGETSARDGDGFVKEHLGAMNTGLFAFILGLLLPPGDHYTQQQISRFKSENSH